VQIALTAGTQLTTISRCLIGHTHRGSNQDIKVTMADIKTSGSHDRHATQRKGTHWSARRMRHASKGGKERMPKSTLSWAENQKRVSVRVVAGRVLVGLIGGLSCWSYSCRNSPGKGTGVGWSGPCQRGRPSSAVGEPLSRASSPTLLTC